MEENRKRRRGKAVKRRLAGVILLSAVCINVSGCGKETEKGSDFTVYHDSAGYMEDGMVYQDYDAGLTKYLDYATGEYYPLCARPNCFHDSGECAAHVLCEEAKFMGRLGDKWYYYREWDTEAEFHSCDLDGGNDRVIKVYPLEETEEDGYKNWGWQTAWGNVLFQDGNCFAAMSTDNMEEDPNNPGAASGVSANSVLYRYDLETGEREALCPMKTMRIPCYTLWGIYKNQLIYSELLNDGEGEKWVSGLRTLDLETKEITDLGIFAREVLNPGYVSGNLLLYNEPEGDESRLMEYNLETGEKRMIYEGGGFYIIWEPELKTFHVQSPEDEETEWIYQYTEEGECKLLYKDVVFEPLGLGGDLLVGWVEGGEQQPYRRAVLKKEDFLAGKTNWTVIEEE